MLHCARESQVVDSVLTAVNLKHILIPRSVEIESSVSTVLSVRRQG